MGRLRPVSATLADTDPVRIDDGAIDRLTGWQRASLVAGYLAFTGGLWLAAEQFGWHLLTREVGYRQMPVVIPVSGITYWLVAVLGVTVRRDRGLHRD
jgi:hypothetical protein